MNDILVKFFRFQTFVQLLPLLFHGITEHGKHFQINLRTISAVLHSRLDIKTAFLLFLQFRRNILFKHILQRITLYGFAQIIIKAFCQIFFTDTCHGIRCESDHRCVNAQVSLQLFGCLQCLYSVHLRHHMIQQYDVIMLLLHQG